MKVGIKVHGLMPNHLLHIYFTADDSCINVRLILQPSISQTSGLVSLKSGKHFFLNWEVQGSNPSQVLYSWWPSHCTNVGCSARLKTSVELNPVTKGKQGTFPFLFIFIHSLYAWANKHRNMKIFFYLGQYSQIYTYTNLSYLYSLWHSYTFLKIYFVEY